MTGTLLREFIREHLIETVRRKLDMSLPDDLREVAKTFTNAGYKLFVVGGSVRDAIQGIEPKDYDLATDAVPDVVIDLCKSMPGHSVVEVGKSFGVVKVVTPEKNEYEIATFRSDIGKGRRPDAVEFTSIENDVLRRDLTINALFYDIDAGEIVDYVGGIADIENGVVRAVGDASERFDEDRLRILRALRFAARMGSDLDPRTAKAIKDDNGLEGVSPERIRDEFLKGVKSAKNVQHFLDLITEYDLWPQVFPNLKVVPTSSVRSAPVTVALLLDENDPQVVSKKLNSLKYSAIEVSQVSFLLRFKDLTPANAYRLRKAFATSHLTDVILRQYVHARGEPSHQLFNAFEKYEPITTGEELVQKGFVGQAIGKEMERIETERFKELT